MSNDTSLTLQAIANRAYTDATQSSGTDLKTKIAGEDLTNDVMKVEGQFSYATINSAATTTVKSAAGLVATVNILGGTLGPITIYDNTAASGTAICPYFIPSATLPNPTIHLNAKFATGLTVLTASATAIEISYR